MAKILVTGGAGFIGSQLAKKLIEEKNQVVIIDNLNDYYTPRLKRDRLKFLLKGKKFVFYQADISNLASLNKIFKKHSFNAIFHLAAQPGVRYSLTNPGIYEKYNVLGTLNMLELARKFKIKKFIFASSSSVYGRNSKLPFSETDRTDSQVSLYAATKKSCEHLTYAFHQLYGLKICALRFFTVYGPWGRPDMAYFKFANLMSGKKPIDIYNYGKLSRDFTYIDDIVNGVMRAYKRNFAYEVINLGNDKPEKLGYLISLLEENFKLKAKKNYLPMQPGDVTATWADIRKAKKLLNYRPKTSLRQGIKKFADWYKQYYKI